MLGDLLKSIFRPSPADRAFNKCMAASKDLGTAAIMFHESFKIIGTELQPDESALDKLGCILSASPEAEQTAERVSVFLGCIVTEQLGGTWQRTDGGYKIMGVGAQKETVDLSAHIRAPLTGQPPLTPRAIYEQIRERVNREGSFGTCL
jgi:hypothetical protein